MQQILSCGFTPRYRGLPQNVDADCRFLSPNILPPGTISVSPTQFPPRLSFITGRPDHRRLLSGAYSSKVALVNTLYSRVGECLVFPALPRRRKPRALIHFLGGAFIGAVPEVTYSLFIELLAKEGFLVVATPYNVTFDHAVATEEVHGKFKDCLAILLQSGLSPFGLTADDTSTLPVFCVGHSNGALLQLLIGSRFQDHLPKANAVIAFNNKPAADAVPYFEQFGPLIAQFTPILGRSLVLDVAKVFPGDQVKTMLDASLPLLIGYDEESLRSLQRFVEQIPSVFDQIAQGLSEFRPTPSENRRTIGNSYSVKNTLLVKYAVDAIDETDLIEEILRPRVQAVNGGLSKSILNGNHVTPCGQDIKWKVGNLYTPADAVGQLLKVVMLTDIRETVQTVTHWFESFM